MAGVSWNSSSMNSFFNTSLNLNSSGTNSIFGSISDSKLIKSGTYKKLMKSYFETVDADDSQKSSSASKSRHANSYTYDPKGGSSTDKSSSSSSSGTSKSRHACTYAYDPQKSTISTVRNKVLDSLLDKSEKKQTTSTNKVLNELLKKDQERKDAAADGTVTNKTDTTATNSSAAEAAAGTVIDKSV